MNKPKEIKIEKGDKKASLGDKIKRYLKNLTMQVSIQDQVILARHLAIMAKAGIPLLDSLKMVQKQARSKALVKILTDLIDEVSNGQYLSTALEKYESIFGSLFINVIRVGEVSGILAENLNYLADELKKKQSLRKKVIGAMIYPFVILVATFGVTALLVLFIFPKILPVFATLRVELPITTRILIYISNLLTNHGFTVVLIAFIALALFWISLKFEKVRYVFHRSLLYVPIFRKIVVAINMANFSRTLGLLLRSGVKIVEAIIICAATTPNLAYRKALNELAESARRGVSISKFLSDHKALYPAMVSQMAEVGEGTGNLSETLLYVAEFYESEVDEFTKNLSNILEPIVMVLMGSVVGFVAISIITPIYAITESVGNIR
ncbi:MAG: Uncharacterized protein G01um10143_707 [Parcubacteria group bacterium Gr01-1014_3]|nr:MAG: Uncharacterized protein G01um10143_707 [Parcubacteria group bacterium Gr01-1014_3]